MRFYRVGFESDRDNSSGFNWFTSRREAEAAVQVWQAKSVDDNRFRAEIREVHVTATRTGIRLALNMYAGHPDNG